MPAWIATEASTTMSMRVLRIRTRVRARDSSKSATRAGSQPSLASLNPSIRTGVTAYVLGREHVLRFLEGDGGGEGIVVTQTAQVGPGAFGGIGLAGGQGLVELLGLGLEVTQTGTGGKGTCRHGAPLSDRPGVRGVTGRKKVMLGYSDERWPEAFPRTGGAPTRRLQECNSSARSAVVEDAGNLLARENPPL